MKKNKNPSAINFFNPPKSTKEPKWFLFFYHIGNLVFHTAYQSGLLVIKTTGSLFMYLKNQINQTIKNFNIRSRTFRSKAFLKTIGIYFLLCFFGWGFLIGLRITANALQIKNSLLQNTETGIVLLEQAKGYMEKQEFDTANEKFKQASIAFEKGKSDLVGENSALNRFINFIPQSRDVKNLLDSATLISHTGQSMITFSEYGKKISFSPEGVESDGNIVEIIHGMQKSLEESTGNLLQAEEKISKINASHIPASKRQEFNKLSTRLTDVTTSIASFNSVFQLTSSILLGNKNVLLLFENNNELRPGGGFMGTFGKFSLDNGKIVNLHISSIYDLDGQLKKNVIPPSPMLYVNTRWYLRDTNWFVDFKQNAKKISAFYEYEGGETPDLIIALTPNLITSILEITGPISIPAYNAEFSAENFVEKAQAISTISDNSTLNTPKQVLADFFPALIQKVSGLESSQLPKIISAIHTNLNQKQIAIFSKDTVIENQLEAFNWTGSVKETDRDYLQINMSNLGGTKTDRDLQTRQDIQSTIHEDGSIENVVTYSITNPLEKIPETKHTAFVRFLVPKGSSLLSFDGFTKMPESPKPSFFAESDTDVVNWEKDILKNLVTGTLIGEESGKTFFANWVVIEGGETKTITIHYKLPFIVRSQDKFSMQLQKQIGAMPSQVTYSLDYPNRKLLWKSEDKINTSSEFFHIEKLLESDQFYGFVLKNK